MTRENYFLIIFGFWYFLYYTQVQVSRFLHTDRLSNVHPRIQSNLILKSSVSQERRRKIAFDVSTPILFVLMSHPSQINSGNSGNPWVSILQNRGKKTTIVGGVTEICYGRPYPGNKSNCDKPNFH